MKPLGEFIKSTLISGLLIILPLGLVAMFVMKIVGIIEPLAAPIVGRLPLVLHFPVVIASLLLFLLCLVAGLLAQTRAGRGAGISFESAILRTLEGDARAGWDTTMNQLPEMETAMNSLSRIDNFGNRGKDFYA